MTFTRVVLFAFILFVKYWNCKIEKLQESIFRSTTTFKLLTEKKIKAHVFNESLPETLYFLNIQILCSPTVLPCAAKKPFDKNRKKI